MVHTNQTHSPLWQADSSALVASVAQLIIRHQTGGGQRENNFQNGILTCKPLSCLRVYNFEWDSVGQNSAAMLVGIKKENTRQVR